VDLVLVFTELDLLETSAAVDYSSPFEGWEDAQVTNKTQRFTASPEHPKMLRALLTEVYV
jgi:hypothetical protein